jgi:hypothetical protein
MAGKAHNRGIIIQGMNMKKALLIILGLSAAVLLAMAFYVDIIVKSALNKELPKLLGVPAHVGSVNVNFTNGMLGLDDVVIGAPAGSKIPYTFKLGAIAVKIPLRTILHPGVGYNIDFLTIESPSLYYSITPHGSNIKTIMNNVSAYSKSASSKPTTQQPAASKHSSAERKMNIGHFYMTNINANLVVYGGRAAATTIDKIELKNIGTVSSKVTIASAVNQVLAQVMQRLGQQDIKNLLEKTGGAKLKSVVDQQAKSIGSKGAKSLKKLFSH